MFTRIKAPRKSCNKITNTAVKLTGWQKVEQVVETGRSTLIRQAAKTLNSEHCKRNRGTYDGTQVPWHSWTIDMHSSCHSLLPRIKSFPDKEKYCHKEKIQPPRYNTTTKTQYSHQDKILPSRYNIATKVKWKCGHHYRDMTFSFLKGGTSRWKHVNKTR